MTTSNKTLGTIIDNFHIHPNLAPIGTFLFVRKVVVVSFFLILDELVMSF